MPVYFIEMGQGLIVPETEKAVIEAGAVNTWPEDDAAHTSALYSCTFIAGYNEETKRYGAYHYPANCLLDNSSDSQAVQAEMKEWVAQLQPTKIGLIFAGGMVAGKELKDEHLTKMNEIFSESPSEQKLRDEENKLAMGTEMRDAYAVWNFFKTETGVMPEMKLESSAVMKIENKALHIGNAVDLEIDIDDSMKLQNYSAGRHGRNGQLIVIGRNRNLPSQQRPVISMAARRSAPSHGRGTTHGRGSV